MNKKGADLAVVLATSKWQGERCVSYHIPFKDYSPYSPLPQASTTWKAQLTKRCREDWYPLIWMSVEVNCVPTSLMARHRHRMHNRDNRTDDVYSSVYFSPIFWKALLPSDSTRAFLLILWNPIFEDIWGISK